MRCTISQIYFYKVLYQINVRNSASRWLVIIQLGNYYNVFSIISLSYMFRLVRLEPPSANEIYFDKVLYQINVRNNASRWLVIIQSGNY